MEPSEDQRQEMYREFTADHMKRQTKALETIRTILLVWAILAVIGIIFFIAATSSPY